VRAFVLGCRTSIMKPRSVAEAGLGLVLLLLTVACSNARAGIVSPNGKLVAYTVPVYDEDANLCNELWLRATDGASAKRLGRVSGERDRVSWVGNDRILLCEFAESPSLLGFDTAGKPVADILLPAECAPLYLALSPDGGKVAFTGGRTARGQREDGLFVYEARSGNVKLLIQRP
jgi:hypothetical protein